MTRRSEGCEFDPRGLPDFALYITTYGPRKGRNDLTSSKTQVGHVRPLFQTESKFKKVYFVLDSSMKSGKHLGRWLLARLQVRRPYKSGWRNYRKRLVKACGVLLGHRGGVPLSTHKNAPNWLVTEPFGMTLALRPRGKLDNEAEQDLCSTGY
ncbi:hypothetical protein K503DRAFT_781291 [Rhizopogon vinicolor AM-OR11-026]|uniref:Uncharacterized protein n=1 Tax=Rhizopogon vinicolor AM-OR11-026 TaxID=1314800 RepID=A0A1B7N6W4_9AGAM|nr:hypothetical protein K503DRAFT_781291 [Rhizopogon vinicolor AM-OR11-026]